jgi:hypothetical protein
MTVKTPCCWVADEMNTPPPEQQNRRTTRSALAEIPARLGMLSVSDNGRLPPVTAIGNATISWCFMFLGREFKMSWSFKCHGNRSILDYVTFSNPLGRWAWGGECGVGSSGSEYGGTNGRLS